MPVTPEMCCCGVKLSKKANSSGLCRSCYYDKWKISNLDKYNAYAKNYRNKNKNKLNLKIKEWRANNKDKINSYYHNKRKDPLYKIAHNMRSRLYDALKLRTKPTKTEELIGCSFNQLIAHLESQFELNMNWNNYGKYWSVDHVIPFASIDVNNIEELKKICHYSNLRPLTISDNCSKATQDKTCRNL